MLFFIQLAAPWALVSNFHRTRTIIIFSGTCTVATRSCTGTTSSFMFTPALSILVYDIVALAFIPACLVIGAAAVVSRVLFVWYLLRFILRSFCRRHLCGFLARVDCPGGLPCGLPLGTNLFMTKAVTRKTKNSYRGCQ